MWYCSRGKCFEPNVSGLVSIVKFPLRGSEVDTEDFMSSIVQIQNERESQNGGRTSKDHSENQVDNGRGSSGRIVGQTLVAPVVTEGHKNDD